MEVTFSDLVAVAALGLSGYTLWRQRKGDDGARACALRALEAFARVRPTTSELYRSVLKAKNRLAGLSETADGANVRKLAADVLTALRE